MKDERAGAGREGHGTGRPGGLPDPVPGSPSQAYLTRLLAREESAEGLRAAWRASEHAGRDAALDREVDELCRLREGLARSGRAAREVLAQAATRREARGEELVERFLRERLDAGQAPGAPVAVDTPDAGGPSMPSARRWALVSVAAALAASLLFFVGLRDRLPADGGAQEQHELWLGADQSVELLEPRGPQSAWGSFRWRPSDRADVWYELVVSAPDGRELARVEGLRGESWQPSDGAAWPARIRWRLSAFDADGELGTWSAEAWLR